MTALSGSRYNVLVPLRGERWLAYNALSGAMGLWDRGDRAMYDAARAGAPLDRTEPGLFELVRSGFLVAPGVDELALLEGQYRAHRFDPGQMVLTLAPTMSCNFGCDYCFQGQDKPRDTMPQDVQDAVVAMVTRALPKLQRLHVAWYGGEPLLRRSVIEALSDRLIPLCDGAGVRYDAMIVTNGFLLGAEAAKSLAARRVQLAQVTLDGSPNYHDQRRALLSGKPTFERIARNLREAIESTSMTVSVRVNIDERNRADIEGLVDWLGDAGLGATGRLQVYFAPVEAITEGCHAVSDLTLGKREYGALEAELTRRAWERGLCPLPYPPRFRGTCGAVRPQGLVVLPSGDVHKCWDTVNEPDKAVGTVFDVDAITSNPLAKKWAEWTPFTNESCRGCRILPVCAGACAYKFVHPEAQRGEAATLPCPSWKYNLKERLVLKAEKMGAIGPEDYDVAAITTDPAELCADLDLLPEPFPAAAK